VAEKKSKTMKGRYDEGGRRKSESDRRDDRCEEGREARGRHLHRSTSSPTDHEIRNREIMAGRHNLSSVRRDQLKSLAKAREVNAGSRQGSVTKNYKDSPTSHHSHQPRKNEDKREEDHKFKIEIAKEKQSRSTQQEAEGIRNIEMAPKMKKTMVTKPSPKKVSYRPKEIKDESLKGRLERILSAKTKECNWGVQRKLVK